MIVSDIKPARPETARAVLGLCDTIQAVGTDAFPERFADLMFDCFGVSEFLVFQRSAPLAPPVALFSRSLDRRSEERAGSYCADFFRHDPIFDVLNEDCADGSFAIRVSAEEIRHHKYRTTCFTRPGIGEKLTLARHSEGFLIALSVYRRRCDGAFDPASIDELSHFANLLLPILSLHYRLAVSSARQRRVSSAEMEDCVAWAFPELTEREVAVCARSILGVTAEGIALDLGIKQTSVLTYRRRAYARLNVNSINQLSTMLIQSSAARQLAAA